MVVCAGSLSVEEDIETVSSTDSGQETSLVHRETITELQALLGVIHLAERRKTVVVYWKAAAHNFMIELTGTSQYCDWVDSC